MDAVTVEDGGLARASVPCDGKSDTTFDLSVGGMSCASCVSRVERALTRVPGVLGAEVNLATERARVTATRGAVNADRLAAAVQEAGYDARPIEAETAPPAEADAAAARSRRALFHLLAAAILSAPLLAGMAGHMLGAGPMLPGWVQFALATPVQFWLGWRFYVAGWKAVRVLAGNMDLLVALGTSAAWGLSVHGLLMPPQHQAPALYFESSALIITFILLGKWLEARARGQTASAIRALMRPAPGHGASAPGEHRGHGAAGAGRDRRCGGCSPRRAHPGRWPHHRRRRQRGRIHADRREPAG